jgi:hypothetical protein
LEVYGKFFSSVFRCGVERFFYEKFYNNIKEFAMKKISGLILLLTIILFCNCNNFAQIPNAGFEEWSLGNPTDWCTVNLLGEYPVTQTTDAHSGNYALRAELKSLDGFGQALVWAGSDGHGFLINQRYAQLTGYYKFAPISSGDKLDVIVALVKGGFEGTGVGGGGFLASERKDEYTKFIIPLTYTSSDIPDLCEISFLLGGVATVGSYYIIDDLELEGITDVDANQIDIPNEFKLYQNFPNPFNPTTIISYSIPKTSFVNIKIFDMLGREIATLVNEEKQKGNHEIVFNGSSLTSGIYFYRMKAGGTVETRKLILIK